MFGSPPAVSAARLSSRTLQVRQHLIGVSLWFYVIEDVLDLAVGANDERGPRDAHYFLAIHILLFDHTEQIRNLLVGIGQQRKRQTELVLKLLLRRRRVFRNTEQHRSRLFDRRVAIAKAAGLLGTSRRIRFGIKIEHDSFAAKIFQGNLFAVLIRRNEVWGFIINFHASFS